MDEYEYLTVWLKKEEPRGIEIGECRTFISPERVLIVVETDKETRVFNSDTWASFMGKPLVRV